MTAHDMNKTFRVRLRVKSFPLEKAGYTHAMPSAIPATLSPEWKEWLNRPYPAKERRPARVRLRVTHCKNPDIRMSYSHDPDFMLKVALGNARRAVDVGSPFVVSPGDYRFTYAPNASPARNGCEPHST